MTQEIKEWYDRAVVDLGVAKHLKKTYYPSPTEIIYYHCQQAAEKAYGNPPDFSIKYMQRTG